MNWILPTIATAITAFIATNLDDLILLMLFFAQEDLSVPDAARRFQSKYIVAGQYLGFAILILASLPGFLGGLIIPKAWIGLLGLMPIAIGIKHWFDRDQPDEIATITDDRSKPKLLHPQIYQVAAVTFANGGDNISIYVSLFASSNLVELGVTLLVFFALIGVWCFLAQRLANQPAIARTLTRYSSTLVPLVLIGLGLFILIENDSFSLLQ